MCVCLYIFALAAQIDKAHNGMEQKVPVPCLFYSHLCPFMEVINGATLLCFLPEIIYAYTIKHIHLFLFHELTQK